MTLDRRNFLKTIAVGTAAAGAATVLAPANASAKLDKGGKADNSLAPNGLETSDRFIISIEGIGDNLPGCIAVSGGTMRTALIATTSGCTAPAGGDATKAASAAASPAAKGNDPKAPPAPDKEPSPPAPTAREYSYGKTTYGDVELTFKVGVGSTKLQEWADKAMKLNGGGKSMRRDISIYHLGRDKAHALRKVIYSGALPVAVDGPIAGGNAAHIKTIVFTCNVDRIEEAKG